MTTEPNGTERGEANPLGEYIKLQRRLANLSLRQLANLSEVSNPYLSQVERGLHAPSVRVLRSIARALNMSAESMLEQAGLFDERDDADAAASTESAIRNDSQLTSPQKQALLGVYRSYVSANEQANGTARHDSTPVE